MLKRHALALLLWASNFCTACAPSSTDAGRSGNGSTGAGGCDGASCNGGCRSNAARSLSDIGHLVIIYLENRSFDHLYGGYPEAEGLQSPAARIEQIDEVTEAPYPTLPHDLDESIELPNAPFDISRFKGIGEKTGDPPHYFYREQLQINGGKMNKFITYGNSLSLVVGHYPTATLPLVQLMNSMPRQVTLCDHFFHAAFGGSFLNHFWLISARTPVFPNAPERHITRIDDAGNIEERAVTPDGYAVNALQPNTHPRDPLALDDELVPQQTFATIGDRLNDAGIDWAWYAGGWNDAVEGKTWAFGFHHQPFIYFANYAEGDPRRARHLKDEEDFLAAAAAGKLPPVSFVKPLGWRDEHPGFPLLDGENHAAELVRAVINGPNWCDAAVIVTYDENGGFWDHVPPPLVDQWGPGTRVPAIVFSRFAKGRVDSTSYDTTALLKLIETRWKLPPLGARDAAQADMSTHAFNFGPASTEAGSDADRALADGSADGNADRGGAADASQGGEAAASGVAPPAVESAGPSHAAPALCAVPPVPSGMGANRPSNPFAYIPPQCYTQTRTSQNRASNPCYPCHQSGAAPNFVDDAHLQSSLQFPVEASTNRWQNLFDPPKLRGDRLTDADILAYVRRSNYFDERGGIAVQSHLDPLAAAWDGEGDGTWEGYRPDVWFHFDDRGFDVAPDGRDTGWRAFAYYPFPGTFLPTNGSMDDVLIRLPAILRQRADGASDRAVYEINLAVVEALVARHDVAIDAADERALDADLDLDGELGVAHRVTFDGQDDGSTRMRYVGRASAPSTARRLAIVPGLFPLGTEFLHSVRYLDVKDDGTVTMAPRMKELRYAKKVKWLDPRVLRDRAEDEILEHAEWPSRARKVAWKFDRGVDNGQGWLLQGFIEAADGSLRPQSYEETLYCVGCHGGIGVNTDSMFALARKIGFDSQAHGWFHWTQHGLHGIREPRRADGAREYELYLRHNGAGDDLRANDEVRARFFDEHHRLRRAPLERLRGDIAELLVPSAPRALDLDRAYRAIVLEQSFVRGRDAVLATARNVLARVPLGASTGIANPVAASFIAREDGEHRRH